MRILFATAVLLAVSSSALFGTAGTLAPGGTLQVTFTAVSNTSDLLFFFNNDPLTVTGSPVLTAQLYNGSTLLGTIVAPPLSFSGNHYFAFVFLSPTSPYVPGITPSTTVDLTSLQNGTINGTIIVTVAGGTLSGFNTTDFILYDAMNAGPSGYTPQGHLIHSPVTLTAPSSVPALSEWGLALLAALLIATSFSVIRGRAASRV